MKKKNIIAIIALAIVLIVVLAVAFIGRNVKATDYDISLNERDIAIEMEETMQLEVVPDKEEHKKLNVDITWYSENPCVATVGEDGLVTGVAGGETLVTASVKYNDREYSASCVVTVKDPNMEYSTYKIRWYTQSKNRGSYEVTEETFERLVGSEVALTQKEASNGLPANYILNTEKSILTGTVQARKGACVLEVYHDVAEVTYYVDYYYESDTKLGTYTTKETKKLKAYAFTDVTAPLNVKAGFVANTKVKGTVLEIDSVTAGSRMNVYCDRIRSQVTISYLNGKETTYTNVYGVGLLDAPANALTDKSNLYYVVSYVNGEKKEVTQEFMKTLTGNTTIEFKVDAVGFTYKNKNGGTLVNTNGKSNTDSYVYLKGNSDVIYLSATYEKTNSITNMYGITLRSGDTTREIRFQHQGVGVMKDHKNEGGTLVEVNPMYGHNTVTMERNINYLFVQNVYGNGGKEVDMAVSDMFYSKEEGSYDVVWAVWEGTLYVAVDGEIAVRLPLTLLDPSWTADKKFEIGFSAFDGLGTDDELKISNVSVKYGSDAEEKLVTDGQVTSSDIHRMNYEPITGTYVPASIGGAAYLYGAQTKEDSGISADIKWVDKDNTTSAVGVSVKVGDQTVQYVVEGMNSNIRFQSNHKWEGITNVKAQTLKLATPFDEKGNSQVGAYVKDGNFYITYNGKQALCVKLQALFPEYAKDSEVAVGLYSWDACNGLSQFENVEILSEEDVAQASLKEWGYYSILQNVDGYDFATGQITATTTGIKGEQYAQVFGASDAWQIEGTMKRPETSPKQEQDMGFEIAVGDQKLCIYGYRYGFKKLLNGNWSDTDFIYPHQNANNTYNFNGLSYAFFRGARTTNEIAFKAVLYKDVFYVWFDGELSWRIPLTEEQFGAFEAGSDYKVTFKMVQNGQQIIHDSSFEDVTVQMGYEVTEQKDIDKTMAQIDANVTRWDNFTIKTLKGAMAEELGTLEKVNGSAYAYLKGTSKDIYLSATWKALQNSKNNYFAGISIKQGNQSREVRFGDNGLIVMANNQWTAAGLLHNNIDYYSGPGVNGNFIWAQNIAGQYGMSVSNTINIMRKATTAGSYQIVWAITDGVLYGSVDGEVVVRMPLTELCSTWTADKEYQIGFSQRDLVANGDVQFKNIEVLYGDEAKVKLVTDKKVTIAESNDFDYEALTGSYIPRSTAGGKYIYSAATSDVQAVQATITMVNKNNTLSGNGITVKSGNNSAQIVVEGLNKAVRVQFNHGWGTPTTVTSLLPTGVKAFNDDGVCKVTGVVKNNMLYILYDGKQAGSIELYKILPGYKTGDAVQLGVYSWDSNNGLTKFSDISFITGEGAEAIKTSDYKWNVAFFTNEVTNSTVDYINGNATQGNDWMTVGFLGESKTWEVSGTINRTDARDKTTAFYTIFRIESGNKTPLQVFGREYGFLINWGWNGVYHQNIANKMAFNTTIFDFYRGARTRDSIEFKAIIANDILYVWFDGVPSWRIPLNQPIKVSDTSSAQLFEGFDTGSLYKFKIRMGEGANRGNYSNLSVKTGDAIDLTAVQQFETFYQNKFGN